MGVIIDEKRWLRKLFIEPFKPKKSTPEIDLVITRTRVVAEARKLRVRWGPFDNDPDQNERYWKMQDLRTAGQYCLVFGKEWLKWVGP